jgi:hypothetical protein
MTYYVIVLPSRKIAATLSYMTRDRHNAYFHGANRNRKMAKNRNFLTLSQLDIKMPDESSQCHPHLHHRETSISNNNPIYLRFANIIPFTVKKRNPCSSDTTSDPRSSSIHLSGMNLLGLLKYLGQRNIAPFRQITIVYFVIKSYVPSNKTS